MCNNTYSFTILITLMIFFMTTFFSLDLVDKLDLILKKNGEKTSFIFFNHFYTILKIKYLNNRTSLSIFVKNLGIPMMTISCNHILSWHLNVTFSVAECYSQNKVKLEYVGAIGH